MNTPDADVMIVGCGPVGLTLSILLAQHGQAVTILERQPQPYPLPRAVHLDHEVARIFQSAGIGNELEAITEPADVYEWRNAEGTTLLRLGRVGSGASGWPMSQMFHQPALEAALERRAGDLGVEIRRGRAVAGLSQHQDVVALATGDGEILEGRYVVGCDGANSTIRTMLDVPVAELGFFYDWLIVDVVLRHERVFDPINLQVCDPARPTTVVSGGPGRRRWEFMRLDHETLDELESRAWELLEPWDVRPDNATLERRAVYTFAARYAERWRSGRVLLAGDAAHQMPPFAGQGMCAGVRDAANLAWKLDLVLTGSAPDALLDTYDQERLASARQAIEFSVELGKIICIPDPDAARARDEAMAAAVGPEPTDAPPLPGIEAGVIQSGSPHAGSLFVQGIVAGRRFDDIHGAGWRLVTSEPEPIALDRDTAEWFASIGGRVATVPADDPVYGRWFAEHGATSALQRPDFHLYGTATSPSGGAALVHDLRTRLAMEPTCEGAVL
jgi:flavoprotein hydroxylase